MSFLNTLDSANKSEGNVINIDIDKPRYDQSTFIGRLKHFAAITDMRKTMVSSQQLEEAKLLVENHRLKLTPPGITEEQLWKAKSLYDSAYHPDTGTKMNLMGRMSFQVPGGMAVTALMLQFYKTPLSVALTQWGNQSFNALVNYTNRNAVSSESSSSTDIIKSYATATSTALAVALSLNIYSRKAPPIVARLVPFVAVAAANAVNIPFSRQNELKQGVMVISMKGDELGYSKKCAKKGIAQVLTSRVVMAAPGMIFVPVIMEKMLKKKWFRKAPKTHLAFQTLALGCFLIFMVPIACALYPQNASMKFNDLEEDLKQEIELKYKGKDELPDRVYFNKGL